LPLSRREESQRNQYALKKSTLRLHKPDPDSICSLCRPSSLSQFSGSDGVLMVITVGKRHDFGHGGDLDFGDRTGAFELLANLAGRIEKLELNSVVARPALQKH